MIFQLAQPNSSASAQVGGKDEEETREQQKGWLPDIEEIAVCATSSEEKNYTQTDIYSNGIRCGGWEYKKEYERQLDNRVRV